MSIQQQKALVWFQNRGKCSRRSLLAQVEVSLNSSKNHISFHNAHTHFLSAILV